MSGIDDILRWNCSTIFLLYPLGLNRLKLNEYGFQSCYLEDEFNNIEYNNPVFLLFKPKDLGSFQVFLNEEYDRVNEHTNTQDLRADYDRGNGEIVLVYEFPEQFSGDYKKFLKGKYSKFSPDITKTYPKVISYKEAGKTQKTLGTAYRIITKDRDSKKAVKEIVGDNPVFQEEYKSMADMIEERFGVTVTPEMELWSLPNKEKETLKL